MKTIIFVQPSLFAQVFLSVRFRELKKTENIQDKNVRKVEIS
jgi:hypothetical protein